MACQCAFGPRSRDGLRFAVGEQAHAGANDKKAAVLQLIFDSTIGTDSRFMACTGGW